MATKKDFTVNTAPVYDTIAQATTKGRKPRKTYTPEQVEEFKKNFDTSGRKGAGMDRFNVAFTPENTEYIRTMSRVCGQTKTKFINKLIADHRERHKDLFEQAKSFLNSI